MSDALVDIGLVDRAQLARVVAQQPPRLLLAIVDAGLVDEDRLVRALASALKLETVTPATMKIHERVLSHVPAPLALRRGVLPVAIKRANQADYLYVALADPVDADGLEEVKRATGCELSPVLAPPSQLEAAIERYYRNPGSASTPDKSASPPPRPPRPAPSPASISGVGMPAPIVGTPLGGPSSSAAGMPSPVSASGGMPAPILGTPGGGMPAPAPRAAPSDEGLPSPLDIPEETTAENQRDEYFSEASGAREERLRHRGPRGPEEERSPRNGRDGAASPDLFEPSPAGADEPEDPAPLKAPPLPKPRRDGPGAELSTPPSIASSRTIELSIDETEPVDELRAAFERVGLGEGAESRTVLDEVPEEEIDLESDPNIPSPAALAAWLPRSAVQDEVVTDFAKVDDSGAFRRIDLAKSQLARLLELPVAVDSAPSPFDDLRGVKLRAGLEKTGIIPALDFEREPFDPPPFDREQLPEARHVVGVGDIPVSPVVRLRTEPPDAMLREGHGSPRSGMGGSAARPPSMAPGEPPPAAPPPAPSPPPAPPPAPIAPPPLPPRPDLPEAVRQALEPDWADLAARPSKPAKAPLPRPASTPARPAEPPKPRSPSRPPPRPAPALERPAPSPPAPASAPPTEAALLFASPSEPAELPSTLELRPIRSTPAAELLGFEPRRSEPPAAKPEFSESSGAREENFLHRGRRGPEDLPRPPPKAPEVVSKPLGSDVPTVRPTPSDPPPARTVHDAPTARPEAAPAVVPSGWVSTDLGADGPEEEPTNPRIRAAAIKDKPKAPEPPSRESQALVDAMLRGESLSSPDRARLVLALGRLLIEKRLITAIELASLLDRS